ncbi:MAG: 30S ribosomal protein S8 [Legionellales bacterium]|jgi:small subunit ribosomal protein S8|nr:30S ribosomal protein S8 [Legionellales bacterium]
MSMQDPIADMLTRIRNANMRNHPVVGVPYSVHKEEILKVLKKTGYITNYSIMGDEKKQLNIVLKYYESKSVINVITRVSKSSRRIYRNVLQLKQSRYKSGLGTTIVSTSKGIMTDKDAIADNIGGEVLFYVSV